MPSGKENGGSNPLASQWIKIAAVVTLYWWVQYVVINLAPREQNHMGTGEHLVLLFVKCINRKLIFGLFVVPCI